jgi:hypothetical protein
MSSKMVEINKIKKYRIITIFIAIIVTLAFLLIRQILKFSNNNFLELAVLIPFIINSELLIYHLKKMRNKKGQYAVLPIINILIVTSPVILLVIFKADKIVVYTYMISLIISRIVDQLIKIVVFKDEK